MVLFHRAFHHSTLFSSLFWSHNGWLNLNHVPVAKRINSYRGPISSQMVSFSMVITLWNSALTSWWEVKAKKFSISTLTTQMTPHQIDTLYLNSHHVVQGQSTANLILVILFYVPLYPTFQCCKVQNKLPMYMYDLWHMVAKYCLGLLFLFVVIMISTLISWNKSLTCFCHKYNEKIKEPHTNTNIISKIMNWWSDWTLF